MYNELENLEELVTGLKSEEKATVKQAFKRARDVYYFDTNGVTLKHTFALIQEQAKKMATSVEEFVAACKRKEPIRVLGLYRAVCRGNTPLIRKYLASFYPALPDNKTINKVLLLPRDETLLLAKNFLHSRTAEMGSDEVVSADIDACDVVIITACYH
jgi:hypothetical protein